MEDVDLSSTKGFLQREFTRDAKVIDPNRGYISVSSFNLRMEPQILAAAAALIADHFNNEKIDIIHGIPHSGQYLATAVSLAMRDNVRIHASRKDNFIPTAWKDVYRTEIQSYTTSDNQTSVFSGINLSFVQKGDRVLLIDDVCATGETAIHIIDGLRKKNVTVVGFAVLFDKMFQEGLSRIADLDVNVFSCVRVESIGAGDTITLYK